MRSKMNWISLAAVSLLAPGAIAQPAPPCVPLTPEVVAWWRAEGNAEDSIGANIGLPQNGASFAPGLIGQAFSLDGVNDEIVVPESPATDLSRLPAFTIECWIQPGVQTETFATIYSEGYFVVSLTRRLLSARLEAHPLTSSRW